MPGALRFVPPWPAIHDGNPDQPLLAYQRPLDGQGLGYQRPLDGQGLGYQRPLDGQGLGYQCPLDRQGLGLSSTRPSVVTRVWKDG